MSPYHSTVQSARQPAQAERGRLGAVRMRAVGRGGRHPAQGRRRDGGARHPAQVSVFLRMAEGVTVARVIPAQGRIRALCVILRRAECRLSEGRMSCSQDSQFE